MFYIHTHEGRIFTGPMEQLPPVRPAQKYSGSFSGQAADTRAPEQQYKPAFKDQMKDAADKNYAVPKQNLQRYGEYLQQNKALEPVYHAYQIMSHPVEYLLAADSIGKTNQRFIDTGFQLLPVLNEQRELIATLSKSDFYSELIRSGRKVGEQIRLIDFFPLRGQRVITSDPVTDVRRIARVLVENDLDAMPITDEGGALVGIVSRTDILSCLAKSPPLSLWC